MQQDSLTFSFAAWVDQICEHPLPPSARAFNFNLYEAPGCFPVELIGAPHYDPNDEDWACDEVFVSRPNLFELSHEIVGTEWERFLELVIGFVHLYIADMQNRGSVLRNAEVVTVGFHDGDLVHVWPPTIAS